MTTLLWTSYIIVKVLTYITDYRIAKHNNLYNMPSLSVIFSFQIFDLNLHYQLINLMKELPLGKLQQLKSQQLTKPKVIYFISIRYAHA